MGAGSDLGRGRVPDGTERSSFRAILLDRSTCREPTWPQSPG
jgi:hypothetical protein